VRHAVSCGGGLHCAAPQGGRRVAICDQMEAPGPDRSSARNHADSYAGSILDAGNWNRNRIIFSSRLRLGGELRCRRARPDHGGVFPQAIFPTAEGLRDAVGRLTPPRWSWRRGMHRSRGPRCYRVEKAWLFAGRSTMRGVFRRMQAEHTLRDHFKTASLDGFGLSDGNSGALSAAGGPASLPGPRIAPVAGHVHSCGFGSGRTFSFSMRPRGATSSWSIRCDRVRAPTRCFPQSIGRDFGWWEAVTAMAPRTLADLPASSAVKAWSLGHG